MAEWETMKFLEIKKGNKVFSIALVDIEEFVKKWKNGDFEIVNAFISEFENRLGFVVKYPHGALANVYIKDTESKEFLKQHFEIVEILGALSNLQEIKPNVSEEINELKKKILTLKWW